MLKKMLMIVMVAMLVTLGAVPVFAQDMTMGPGQGPGDALRPAEGMVRIGPGQWQWYVFRSQVPVGVEENPNDVVTSPTDATIHATLRTQARNVDFEIWSADDLNNWRNSSDFEPTGAGTENDAIVGDPLFWEGSFTTNNNYYLIVMNRSSEAAFYDLDITGHVRFPSELALNSDMPTPAVAQTEEAVMSTEEMALTVDLPMPEAAADMADMAATTMHAGTGPESAVMPTTDIVAVEPGQWQWYVFRSQVPFGVEESPEDVVTDPRDATINAALRVKAGGNLNFEVWSPDQLNRWRNDEEFEPLGAGFENEFLPDDPLFWEGSFEANNNYYLIVMNNSSQTAHYTLDITGHVSFPSATTLSVK